jgi:saccharopine dehydrogenase-like NADP-dependent oxidoreductase
MTSHVQNVAIIGAGGNIGGVIAEALIKQGKHKVTAITRSDSTSKLPDGLCDIKKVTQSDHTALVEAFKGQEVLIITLGVTADRNSGRNLVDAAVEAKVPYVIPNEYGGDYSDEEFGRDTGLSAPILAMRKYVEEKGAGKTSWIAISCGFWYEYSLSGADFRYGFDFKEKTVTLFDEGKQHITTSTWPQVSRSGLSLRCDYI